MRRINVIAYMKGDNPNAHRRFNTLSRAKAFIQDIVIGEGDSIGKGFALWKEGSKYRWFMDRQGQNVVSARKSDGWEEV